MVPFLCILLKQVRKNLLPFAQLLWVIFQLKFFTYLFSVIHNGTVLFLEGRLNFSKHQILSPFSSQVTVYLSQNLKFSSKRPYNFKIGAKT